MFTLYLRAPPQLRLSLLHSLFSPALTLFFPLPPQSEQTSHSPFSVSPWFVSEGYSLFPFFPLDPQNPLVRELSEVFEAEASKSISPAELALPQQTPLSPELDLPLETQLSLEDQLLPWSQTDLPSKQVFTKEEAKQSTETIIACQNSDKPSRDPETPQSSGTKLKSRMEGKEARITSWNSVGRIAKPNSESLLGLNLSSSRF